MEVNDKRKRHLQTKISQLQTATYFDKAIPSETCLMFYISILKHCKALMKLANIACQTLLLYLFLHH